MKITFRKAFRLLRPSPRLLTVVITLFLAAPAFAQSNSTWENAVGVLQQAFTSTIARGLSEHGWSSPNALSPAAMIRMGSYGRLYGIAQRTNPLLGTIPGGPSQRLRRS